MVLEVFIFTAKLVVLQPLWLAVWIKKLLKAENVQGICHGLDMMQQQKLGIETLANVMLRYVFFKEALTMFIIP